MYLCKKEGQKVKKTFWSVAVVTFVLCVFLAFPVCADETEFVSLEFYAPQSSDYDVQAHLSASNHIHPMALL